MNFNFKNWKTTLGGVVAIVVQFGPVFFPKYINEAVANTISTIAVSLGLAVAKDHNVTGGTVLNTINDASVVKQSAKSDQL